MLAESEILQFLSQLPEEALAATLILSLIFTFVTVIVTVVSITHCFESISLARMSKELIEDLLSKGYSPQEIEPLVNGPNRWKGLQKLFASVRHKAPFGRAGYRQPVSPVKQTMV